MTSAIELSAFVEFTPSIRPTHYQIGRRGHQTGLLLGIIRLKGSAHFEAVLQFPDGAQEKFLPRELLPLVPDEGISQVPTPIAA